MSALAAVTFDEKRYARLLAKHRPKVPENDKENERLTNILLELDEKDSLSPEETALFEGITVMVQHYEHKHYPIKKLPPAGALRAVMDERGLKHKDLAGIIGNKGLTSEILNGNREISKTVARKLANGLSVSIELFLA
jgi:HTH-type transcriptional regulator / antitoxin HigA